MLRVTSCARLNVADLLSSAMPPPLALLTPIASRLPAFMEPVATSEILPDLLDGVYAVVYTLATVSTAPDVIRTSPALPPAVPPSVRTEPVVIADGAERTMVPPLPFPFPVERIFCVVIAVPALRVTAPPAPAVTGEVFMSPVKVMEPLTGSEDVSMCTIPPSAANPADRNGPAPKYTKSGSPVMFMLSSWSPCLPLFTAKFAAAADTFTGPAMSSTDTVKSPAAVREILLSPAREPPLIKRPGTFSKSLTRL